jgi:phage terminase large subunit-like protein
LTNSSLLSASVLTHLNLVECPRRRANAILVTKQASGSATIDPLMAAFNAIALMSTNPWSSRPEHICDLGQHAASGSHGKQTN